MGYEITNKYHFVFEYFTFQKKYLKLISGRKGSAKNSTWFIFLGLFYFWLILSISFACTSIFDNWIILFSAKWAIRFGLLYILQTRRTHTHMATRQQDALTFVSQANWTSFIFIIAFKQVFRTINVTYSKRQRTPLQDLRDQRVLFFLRHYLVTVGHKESLSCGKVRFQDD